MHDIFMAADDVQSHETLFIIFNIYKAMLSLGDSKLIELLLSKDYYLDTLGALECKLNFRLVTFCHSRRSRSALDLTCSQVVSLRLSPQRRNQRSNI
jgi:hypothetical protein